MSARRPVAVALDGDPTPAWQARALEGLVAEPSLEVVQVHLTGPHTEDLSRRVLRRAERRFFGLGGGALALTPAQCSAVGGDGAERAPSLLVWLSSQPAPVQDAQVMSMRHAGCDQPPERAVERAVLEGDACVQSEVLLSGERGPVVVARTFSGVRTFSAMLTCDLMLWKLAALVVRAARRLPGLDEPAAGDPGQAARAPSAARLAVHTAVCCARVLASRLLFSRPWALRLRRRSGAPTDGWSSEEERLVRWRRGHVYADPFLVERKGVHHLFCEEIPAGSTRGVISHTLLHPDGSPAEPPEPVLEADHHLSYPLVFAQGGQMWMIPETSAANRVELYRAVRFPGEWQREAVLLEGVDAVDATILAHDERLWLFVGIAAPGASSLDELHLFWADEPRGPWSAHPANPVVSDARRARPAGAILRWESRLVRPGQDGSRRYGGAVSFQEIDVLSTSEYDEHEIARLEPADLGGGARATHSYAADARFEAVDLRRRELRGARALRRMVDALGLSTTRGPAS